MSSRPHLQKWSLLLKLQQLVEEFAGVHVDCLVSIVVIWVKMDALHREIFVLSTSKHKNDKVEAMLLLRHAN